MKKKTYICVHSEHSEHSDKNLINYISLIYSQRMKKFLLFGALTAMGLSAAAQIGNPAVNLYMTGTINGEHGLYSLSSTSGGLQLLESNQELHANGGAVLLNNNTYFFSSVSTFLGMNTALQQSISLNDMGKVGSVNYLGSTTPIAGTAYAAATGVETADDVFASIISPTGAELYLFNATRLTYEYKTNLQAPYVAMHMVGEDLLSINTDGKLMKINTQTYAETEVGSTGLTVTEGSTGTYSSAAGLFYLLVRGTAGNPDVLYTVNPATAAATTVGAISPNQGMDGMVVFHPAATSAKYITDMVADLGNPAAATVKFTLPETTFRSIPLSQLTYTVKIDDQEVASAQAQPGETVTVNLADLTDGFHTIAVSATDGSATTPEARVTAYAGTAAPFAPAEVKFTRSGNDNTITWKGVGYTVDGKTISRSKLTYRVVRMPDNTVVCNSTKSSKYTDTYNPDQPTDVYYVVYAMNGTAVSTGAKTESQSIGYINPPYVMTFDDYAVGLGAMQVIDGNHDGCTWYWIDKAAKTRMTNAPKDEYLITPGIKLQAGKQYQLSYFTGTYYPENPDDLEILLGTEPTVEGLNTVVMERHTVSNAFTSADKVRESCFVSVPEDGLYYICFHSCSDKGYQLAIDDIEFIAPTSGSAPGAPTALTLVPDADGFSKVAITVTAPTVDIEGNELTALTGLEISRQGNMVAAFENVVPGETYTFTDNVPASAIYEYSSSASNAEGRGASTYASAYVGVYAVKSPSSLKVKETENDGEVLIEWTPAKDIHGKVQHEDLVTYTLCTVDGDVIIEGLKGTSLKARVCEPEVYGHVNFMLYADNEHGRAEEGVVSNTVAVGYAFEIPYVESFGGNGPDGWVTQNQSMYGFWYLTSNNRALVDGQYVYSLDGDDMMEFASILPGLSATIRSSKIEIAGVHDPVLSFYYNVAVSADDIITVFVNDNGEEHPIHVLNLANEPYTGWQQLIVPMSAYEGKKVSVGMTIEAGNNIKPFLLDDVRVDSRAAVSISDVAVDSDNVSILISDRTLTVTGVSGQTVNVYNVSGALVNSGVADDTFTCTLEPGVYLVNTPARSAKIVIR